jgi:O-antigen ligase
VLSFEATFVLFLYSNELKTVINFYMPVDETVVFGVVAGAIGVFVIYCEGIYLRGVPILVAALLFIFWAVASTAWTPSRLLAYKDATYLISFTVFSVVAGCLIMANRRERAVRFFAFVLLIALGMALYGLFIEFYYGNFRYWAGWNDVEGRIYLAFGRTVVNGTGIAFCIAMFLRFGSIRQFGGIAMFAACLLFLLIGGGRGPFLGAVLAAMVGLVSRPPIVFRGRFELPYALVAALIIISFAVAYIGYSISYGQMTATVSRLASLINEAETSGIAQGPNRWEYWARAYEFFLSAPIIGHGLRSFAVLRSGHESAGAHPHNILLQIGCEMGMIGLLLFFVFFWISLRHATLVRLRHDPLLVCALLFVITSAMDALTGRDLASVRTFFFAISLAGLRPPAIVVQDEAVAPGPIREFTAHWPDRPRVAARDAPDRDHTGEAADHAGRR